MTKVCKSKNQFNNDKNIIPPDGGWGWLVCISGGLSLMVTFSIRKSFGLIFREKFQKLGITNSEITTIINFHISIALFQGFLYGPIYRYLSIRQVALLSALLIIVGIFALAFVETFTAYMISFSIIYGLGTGFHKSATFLSINTYFQNLRRRAHSLTLTLTAIGPMIMPHISNGLLYYYGVQGTVIIFSGIAMHAIAFALLYQPVIWHAKKSSKNIYVITLNDRTECSVPSVETLNTIVEDSCYYNRKYEDHNRNFEIIENSNCCYQKTDNNNSECKEFSININGIDLAINKEVNSAEHNKSDLKVRNNHRNCPKMKKDSLNVNANSKDKQNSVCLKKLSLLFDLGLLCDMSYLNIILGFAFSTVAELNCSLLTPFFLADFGLTNYEIGIVMSTTAFTDLITRFILPYITMKIKWNSRIFYLIGISGLTLMRIAIAQNPPYYIHLILFSFTGAFAAMRSIFMNLVLPEYLPLEKLPAGTGLQQIPSGLFALAIGPAIGAIRDATNYSYVLYILSSFSSLTIILWTIEMVWTQMKTETFKLI